MIDLSRWKFSPDVIAKLESRLQAIDSPWAHELAQLCQPAFRLFPTPGASTNLPIGATRLGGNPDVPKDFEWPTFKGEPLTFLAQINLAHLGHTPLPEAGWLLFFMDDVAYGDECGGDEFEWFRVVYLNESAKQLQRRPHPPTEKPFEPYRQKGVTIRVVACLPDCMDAITKAATKGRTLFYEGRDDHYEVYSDLRHALLTGEESALSNGTAEGPCGAHFLLGHPTIIQDDIREDLRYPFPRPETESETTATRKLRKLPPLLDWQLLLQLDSYDYPGGSGWCWGDAGTLYFWVTKQDLAARRFDRCWMAFQCS